MDLSFLLFHFGEKRNFYDRIVDKLTNIAYTYFHIKVNDTKQIHFEAAKVYFSLQFSQWRTGPPAFRGRCNLFDEILIV